MKIAFVYDVVYPYVKGGVEKRVWELAVRLAKRGHQVHIFGMKFWEGNDILARDGVILHGVCPAQQLYKKGRRTIREALYFSFCLVPPLLKENKFAIIDCQQFPYFSCISAKLAAIIRKSPLVITWHEVWADYWYEYAGYWGIFGKSIERFIAAFTSPSIAVSPTTAQRFTEYFAKSPHRVIPNGIDLFQITSVAPSPEQSDLIFVGRLIREKHVDVLVRAFALLATEQKDLRLIIIGDGPERDDILALIHDLHVENQVSVRGFLDQHDGVIAAMKSSKVFVFPSTREGFGIAALEALACGLPVVTVDHAANAVRDLISEQTGFLSSLSPEDLAKNMKNALRYHDGMRDACIRSVESYDWDRIVDQLENFYQDVIDQRLNR